MNNDKDGLVVFSPIPDLTISRLLAVTAMVAAAIAAAKLLPLPYAMAVVIPLAVGSAGLLYLGRRGLWLGVLCGAAMFGVVLVLQASVWLL